MSSYQNFMPKLLDYVTYYKIIKTLILQKIDSESEILPTKI